MKTSLQTISLVGQKEEMGWAYGWKVYFVERLV